MNFKEEYQKQIRTCHIDTGQLYRDTLRKIKQRDTKSCLKRTNDRRYWKPAVCLAVLIVITGLMIGLVNYNRLTVYAFAAGGEIIDLSKETLIINQNLDYEMRTQSGNCGWENYKLQFVFQENFSRMAYEILSDYEYKKSELVDDPLYCMKENIAWLNHRRQLSGDEVNAYHYDRSIMPEIFLLTSEQTEQGNEYQAYFCDENKMELSNGEWETIQSDFYICLNTERYRQELIRDGIKIKITLYFENGSSKTSTLQLYLNTDSEGNDTIMLSN